MAKTKQQQQQQQQNSAPYVAATETFEFEGKKYAIQCGRFNIPGIGVRTALELAADHESQKALLEIEGQAIAVEVA